MTSSVVGLRRNSIVFPKVKLARNKGHGLCWMVCCLSDPLQLSESCWTHYIWEVCLAYQWVALKTWMLTVSIGQQNAHNFSPWQRLIVCCTPTLQKSNKLGYKVLAHLPCSADLLPTGRRQKMLSKSSSDPRAWIFMLQE